MGGAEVLKQFEIALDISRSISNRAFTVVEGDTGNVLHITLTDDGEPADLSGCRVLAIFSKSTGTSSQDSGAEGGGVTIGGAAMNEVTIRLFNTSFAPGMVECELQVYSGSTLTTLVTSAKFNFTCRRGILNDETVCSTNEYPLLAELMAQAAEAVETAETAAAAAYAAAAATGQDAHAARHAADGPDPVSPGSIGAAEKVHAHGGLTGDGRLGTAEGCFAVTGTGGLLMARTAEEAKNLLNITAATGVEAALTASGWADNMQTVNVAGVAANSNVIVSPAPESMQAWAESAVYCSAQGAGTLTFTCTAVPESALTAHVLILR